MRLAYTIRDTGVFFMSKDLQTLNGKRKSHPRFECIPAMCYNLRIVTESLGYSLRLSVIWRLCT